MRYGRPPDLAVGGACAWQLPSAASGPARARSLLAQTMTALGLPRAQIDDGVLAVSECVTNTFQHANQHAVRHTTGTGRPEAVVPPELWAWARISPVPELVVSVFDTDHDHLPRPSHADLLEEFGRGLDILSAVTSRWGGRHTRSRLNGRPLPGKAVWFSSPLPRPWPGESLTIAPAIAAQKLLRSLAARAVEGTSRSDDRGVSVVQVEDLNLWVEPRCFSFNNGTRGYTRLPLVDLQEAVELVLDRLHAGSGHTRPDRHPDQREA